MRAKVWKGRTTSQLFNCKQYAADIENLFISMWDKFARGEKPDHITELMAEETKKNIKITQVEKMIDHGNFLSNKEFTTATTITT